MKKTILLLAFGFQYAISYAQKPQKIEMYSREQHPIEWYKEQAKAWEAYTHEHPKDPEAWYNLYYAHRILAYHDPADKRTSEEKKKDIDKLVKEMGAEIPDSYEYNLVEWQAGGFDMSKIDYLLKANKLGPDRTEHLDHMINISEIKGNTGDKLHYSMMKYKANEFSSGMLYYNYNVLAGLDSNAILLTVGDNDTYPIWALQAMGIRKDVKVINLSLFLMDDYRKRILDELGAEGIAIDWKNGGPGKDFEEKAVKVLSQNKKHYPLYIALTASGILGEENKITQDHIYLTGLAYQYCEKSIDNMAELRKNFEQRYALDYLDKAFYLDIAPELAKRMNYNYMVPMLKLYEHYSSSGETQKQAWIKNKLMIVIADSPYESQIKTQLAQP